MEDTKYNLRKRRSNTRLIAASNLLHSVTDFGDLALHLAVYYNHQEIVKYLLLKGTPLNSTNIGGYSPLLYAVAGQNFEIVKLLVENGADTKSRNRHFNSALHLASYLQNTQIASYLLEKGMNPNLLNKNKSTALHFATQSRNFPLLCNLTQCQSDINLSNAQGNSPLIFAAQNGDVVMLEYLIAKGANLLHTNQNGESALHFAVRSENPHILLKRLLHHETKLLNLQNRHGVAALEYAFNKHNVILMEEMIANGANINLLDIHGRNILLRRLMNYEVTREEVVLLTSLGADITIVDKYGQNAMIIATQNASFKVIRLVAELNPQFDINYASNDGLTVLHYAAKQKRLKVIKWYLDHYQSDLNINQLSRTGDTAVNYLLRKIGGIVGNTILILKMLITAGADLNLQNLHGEMSLHLAVMNHDIEVCKLLVTNGAKIDLLQASGYSPLILSILAFDKDIVIEYLIKLGANLNLMFDIDNQHLSVLHLVVMMRSKIEILQLLIKFGAPNLLNQKGKSAFFFRKQRQSKEFRETLFLHELNFPVSCNQYLCANGSKELGTSIVVADQKIEQWKQCFYSVIVFKDTQINSK